MNGNIYRLLEDRFRGSRESVKEKLLIYLPFIQPLLKNNSVSRAIDLGCGRGEWLELLCESGYDAIGIDLDGGMLEACAQRGLDVKQGNALEYLCSMGNASHAVISAFHVVEHIAFDQLLEVVEESFRVLEPGGLLILETPNPENIVVATRNFYLDPTHHKPIPSELLTFVVEQKGFKRVKIIRLNEDKSLIDKTDVCLENVLAGASPDYALIAQKSGSVDAMACLDNIFSYNFGLSLEDLAHKWDARFVQIETLLKDTEVKAQQAEVKAQQAEVKAQQAEVKAQQAETVSRQCASQLLSVYHSTSWRITAPLRWSMHQWRLMCQQGIKARGKALVKKILRKLLSLKMAHSSLKPFVNWLAYRFGFVAKSDELSPRTHQIYADLKEAIKQKQKKKKEF